MKFIGKLFFTIIIIFLVALVAGYVFQAKLIFFPGKLDRDFRFDLKPGEEELFLKTADGQTINALFYPGNRQEVVLYFHGNAGDLSGWQYVAEDFTSLGYNFFIIDYRGYGKSSGSISEKGLYADAEAAYQFLVSKKKFLPEHILLYGRSIGSGVAVELATRHHVKGLILEAPYSSLKKLGNEKMPYLLPSLTLRFRFDNLSKINDVQCPVLFIHGGLDTLIPPSHSETLFEKFNGKKKRVIIKNGGHNDLNGFEEYDEVLREWL